MDNLAAQISSEGKSSLAFRTISEVSVEIDVPQHVLRFWESRFSQVKPMKRGGGRRYYRPEDIELLRQIKTYLYKHGYTIKGVQRLLKEHRLNELPSLSAYRMQMDQDVASDVGREIPVDDFEQTFEASLTEVTAPEVEAVHDTQLESSLAAITRIHEEIEIPPEPMRLHTAAELIQQALEEQQQAEAALQPLTHIASKETGYMSAPPEVAAAPAKQPQGMGADARAELGDILTELHALRAMLQSAA